MSRHPLLDQRPLLTRLDIFRGLLPDQTVDTILRLYNEGSLTESAVDRALVINVRRRFLSEAECTRILLTEQDAS